ncbi:MAG: hypothetical protein ACLTCI_10080 [[Clostridium] nexile]
MRKKKTAAKPAATKTTAKATAKAPTKTVQRVVKQNNSQRRKSEWHRALGWWKQRFSSGD